MKSLFCFCLLKLNFSHGQIQQQELRDKKSLSIFVSAGSLFPHNVVLVPLGDDFLYTHEQEWDQQYANYKMIIDYINAHSDEYHAEVK